MRKRSVLRFGISTLLLAGFGAGCSLDGKSGDPALHIDLSAIRARQSYSLLDRDGGLSLAPPTTLSGFKCYAVNVTGPGIADSSRNPSGDAEAEFFKSIHLPNYHCAYRGVVSRPIVPGAASAELALKIPPGNLRLVQVVGVNSQYMCDTGIQDDDSDTEDSGSSVYELGRAVLRDVFQDQSVAIQADWATGNSAADEAARMAKAMDCDDGVCGFPSNNFQEPVSTPVTIDATKRIAQHLDVPVGTYFKRIDLRADVTTAGTIQMAICQSTAGAPPGVDCEVNAMFKKTITVSAGANQILAFEMRHLTNGYLMAQTGSKYYATLTASGGGALAVNKLQATAPGGRTYGFTSGTWASVTTEIPLRLYGCGQ